jgi:phosphomethylpyrimidine synthase
MKITQEVRDFAAKKELEESAALAAGMKEKAAEFVATGGEIYQGERPAGAQHDH